MATVKLQNAGSAKRNFEAERMSRPALAGRPPVPIRRIRNDVAGVGIEPTRQGYEPYMHTSTSPRTLYFNRIYSVCQKSYA